ncbi:MAG: hypothetical protein R2820_01300 [Cyclobacteriaceae bacterium]|nr:hypothetical protein [Cyclobacteriaceae bacterium]
MKRIMNKIIVLTMVVVAVACTDDSLDPFRLSELKKGSLLALRGSDGTAGNLDPDANFFFRDNLTGNETFTYVADFISEDQTLLSGVQVYARLAISNEPEGARVLIKTVPGSAFVAPSGTTTRQGTVSVTLDEVLTAMSLGNPDTLSRTNLLIESDIELTDGTIVPSSAIVNSGLFAASAFFPAHQLNYYAEESDDFRPEATSKLAGEVVTNADGEVTSRPVFPLKAGARDTVMFTFSDAVDAPPVISFSPASAVTPIGAVEQLEDTDTYYQIFEATGVNTTAVTATASGSTWEVLEITLVMKDKTQTINIDNTPPQLVSLETGDLIGRGQLATITAKFNEKMSSKTANRLKVSVSGQGQEGVTDQNMTLSSDGLSLSYVYLFKEATEGSATQGPLTITFTGGADEASNALDVSVLNTAATGALVSDVATPDEPTLDIDEITPDYDYGTQIKWTAGQTSGVGGSTTGRVYWIALAAGDPAPTGFDIDADENGVWTIGTGEDATTSIQSFTASIPVSSGSSGTVFSPLTKNGDVDIWAVFVSSTGNRSAIPAAAQLTSVTMEP